MNVRRTSIPTLLSLAAAFVAVPRAGEATLRHGGDSTIAGSLCVGFDCANNEPMGFATIKIEENNLRIAAADSSVVAGFPTTDWQIEFNSSSSGGGSYFKIRDCGTNGAAGSVGSTCGGTSMFTIEAGADNDSIYVDSSGNQGGNVGFGTTTPVVDLHVLSGNTPTLRLHQDNSSGFTPQTWDVAGNEANFFVRDVTGGSALPFRIEPGTSTNTLVLDNNERVGVGTNAPEAGAQLQMVSSAANNLWIRNPNPGIIQEDSDGANNHVQQRLNNALYRIVGLDSSLTEISAGISMDLDTDVVGINCTDAAEAVVGARLVVGDGDGCSGTFSAIIPGNGAVSTSSRSLKENLQEVGSEGILEKIEGVDVYSYDFKSGVRDQLGLMAEDFHRIFGRGSDKIISDRDVQMALWLAVQELTEQNRALVGRLAMVEAELNDRN